MFYQIIHKHYYINVFRVIYLCVLFALLMQLVNGEKLLSITFLALFAAASAAAMFGIVVGPLTCMYA